MASVGGGKTIGRSNSVLMMTNNIVGVGMLALPVLVQQAGWLVTVAMILVFGVMSSFAATMLVEAISLIPVSAPPAVPAVSAARVRLPIADSRPQGNGHFQQRVEFTTAVGWYFGQRWYRITLVLFNVSLVFGNLASIVVSAQVRLVSESALRSAPSRSDDDAHARRPSRACRR